MRKKTGCRRCTEAHWWDKQKNSEAKCGYYDQRKKLAEGGIVFEGQHGAGSEYGECAFACCNGKHVEVNAIEGEPVAIVHKDGSIDDKVRACIEDYYQTLDAVHEYFKENF